MKGMFSVLGLLLVVALVGLLAKRQFSEMGRAPAAPALTAPASEVPALPAGTPQQQMRQVQQSVEALMQQPRPMPEDK